MSAPRTSHWDAPVHILRYLKSSPGKGYYILIMDIHRLLDIQMRVMLDVLIVGDLLVGIVFSLVEISFRGKARNKMLSLYLVLKQNIEQWLELLVS